MYAICFEKTWALNTSTIPGTSLHNETPQLVLGVRPKWTEKCLYLQRQMPRKNNVSRPPDPNHGLSPFRGGEQRFIVAPDDSAANVETFNAMTPEKCDIHAGTALPMV